MDLTSISTIKNLLQKYGVLGPSKRFGQNFLIREEVVNKLIDAAKITKKDTVVEVGAGLGAITIELAESAKKIIAVEKDKNFIPLLKEATKNFENIDILQDDILKFSIYEILNTKYKVIGNIPYYLTAPLIRKFLEADNPPESMTLMVQKEVAQRICAAPPKMSILAVSVQFYAKPKIISYVPRSAFWPQPEVDSAIIKITPKLSNLSLKKHIHLKDDRLASVQGFFRIVKAGFANPRKQLANNLSKGLKMDIEETKKWLDSLGVDPKRRAETLTVEEWGRLTKTLNSNI